MQHFAAQIPATRCRGCGGWLPAAASAEERRFCGHCGRPVDVRPMQLPELHQPTLGLQSAPVVALAERPILLTRRKNQGPAVEAVGPLLGSPVSPRVGPSWPVETAANLGPAHASTMLASSARAPAVMRGRQPDAVVARPPSPARRVAPQAGPAAGANHPSEARAFDPARSKGYPAFPTRVDVALGSAHNFYAGFDGGLRGGGVFVATCAPFEAGERLLVTLSVAGRAGPFVSRAVVEWSVPYESSYPGAGRGRGSSATPGMGLRLFDIAPELERAAAAFMKAREPIFFEAPRRA